MNPFFSICIPAYECGELLYDALFSVARQSFSDWEVLVANDGSGEETSEICRSQPAIDQDRYTFIDAPHGGQLATRMRMLAAAHGCYILSLDADDEFIGCDALQKIHDAIEATECDVLLFNATRNLDRLKPFVDYSGLSLHQTLFGEARKVDASSVERALADSFLLNNVCCKAFARKCLAADMHEIPVMHMNEDRLQSLWIIQSAKTYALLDTPLYYYRPNPASVTERGFRAEYFDDMLCVEAQVDALRRELGHMGPERDSILLRELVVPALVLTSRSRGDKRTRVEAYEALYERAMRFDGFPRRAARMRPDRQLAVRLFLARRFRALDAYLLARDVIKELLKGAHARGGVRR